MHHRVMFKSYFRNCRLARMSSGHYCLIRDLGPVKGGKGMKHHEVLVSFTLRGLSKRIRRRDFSLEGFDPSAGFPAREILSE
jgi:hypothetical protein